MWLRQPSHAAAKRSDAGLSRAKCADDERGGTRDRQAAGEGMRADFVGAQIDIPAEGHQHGVHIRRQRTDDAGHDTGPQGRSLPAERRRERLP